MRTTLALATVLLLTASAHARPITCSAKPILHGSWRLIDKRRCWYHGRRQIDKAQLTWRVLKHSEPVKPLVKPKRRQRPKPVDDEDDLCCTIWPQPPTEFDRRFQGVR